MNHRIRQTIVVGGVVASLVVGVVSIRVAADLTAGDAPPPAPPVSMQALQAQLTAEQARTASLQQQLDDLLGATDELSAALEAAEADVTADGSTAAQLRKRLKDAQARLKVLTRLLKQAADRLEALGASRPTVPSSGGGGSGGTAKPTPGPTPRPATAFSLTMALGGGGAVAHWTRCTTAGFDSYALVRSLDSEIHYPPEDRDTVVARVPSNTTLSATDAAAPSGRLWYRVYCLTRHDGETKTAVVTPTVSITVP